ncbi:MAG: hypothetical protein ACLROG_19800 [Coprococcus phoceensis]
MNSIISKLSEIETAATAIVKHAESEKDRLDQKMQKDQQRFDEDLAASTKEKLDAIQQNLTSKMNTQLQQLLQSESERTIHSLTREYEIKHEQYAHEILKRITEV